MKQIQTMSLMLVLLLSFACKNRDNSEWVYKVDGKKVTVNQMKNALDGYLALMAQQFQATPEQLKEYLKDPQKAGRPEMVQMLEGLRNELALPNFAERYKQLTLLNLEAKKSGFLKREDVKAKIDFMKKYFIANMYLMDHLKASEVTIPDDQAVAFCEQMRQQDARFRNLPITQCLDFAKQRLTLKALAEKQNKFIQDIIAAYRIETNSKVDLSKVDNPVAPTPKQETANGNESKESSNENQPSTK